MKKLLVLFCFLASLCFGQSADDNIVVVGNQAQPVQWTHQNSIQNALLHAGQNGVVWIPPNYKGTDCNPISVCNPGNTVVIDLRGGMFQTYPAISGSGSGSGSPVSAPFVVLGSSLIAFTEDQFCAFNLGTSPDILCDLNGQLTFNPGGNLGPLLFLAYANAPQTYSAPQTFSAGVTVTGSPCAGCTGIYESGVLTTDLIYTKAIGLTGGAATHTFANNFTYTATTSFGCSCTDQTAVNACKAVPASANSVTLAGTGTDILWVRCSGH